VGLRRLKVNEAIKEALSTVIVAEDLKDPRVGFVTITGVDVTPDLRHATVYVSVLGDRAEREATLEALEGSRGYLQSRLAESLRMKRTPQLQFVYDETLDNAMRISRLMAREEEVLGSEAPEIMVGGEEPRANADEAPGESAEASGLEQHARVEEPSRGNPPDDESAAQDDQG
jgi:ribosome-binding factor A